MQHFEKIVLAAVALLSLWLLSTRAVMSPNKVEYNNRRFAPGQIDAQIRDQADELERKLVQDPVPVEPYEQVFGAFAALVEGNTDADKSYAELYPEVAGRLPQVARYAVADIEPGFFLPNPAVTDVGIAEDRKYFLPAMVGVSEPLADHIRAVIYRPTAVIDERNRYSEKSSEPNDLDFVTVQAQFNVAELYKSFYESFAGDDVPQEWRDPCLASPVFAAVQLDRQERIADGRWSTWQTVPRARIDPRRQMFDLADVSKLPLGGITVRLLQFRGLEMARSLLQPDAYRIASAEEEWFPPSLRDKFLDAQRKLEAQEKRDEAEKKDREREKERSGPGRDRGFYRGRDTGAYRDDERSYRPRPSTGFGMPARGTSRSTTKSEFSKTDYDRALSELYAEVDKLSINEETNLATMTEPLVFWAFDDSIEPGKTYRYRIRLGVFNPVAGTNKIRERDKSKRDDTILWSAFSKQTGPIDIPQRLYFFPLREAGKVVTFQVSRYQLGYWYNWNFPVQQGEVIGTAVQNKVADADESLKKQNVELPESIDYGTGAVLVDVATANGWSAGTGAGLNSRPSEILYSYDGTTIEHLAVNYGNWPRQMQVKFNEIKKLVERTKKPWRRWAEGRSRRSRYIGLTDTDSSERRGDDEDRRRDDGEEEAYRRMMERRGGARR